MYYTEQEIKMFVDELLIKYKLIAKADSESIYPDRFKELEEVPSVPE